MRRVLSFLAIAIAVAAPAFSFDTTKRAGNTQRITLLRAPIVNGYEGEDRFAARVRHQLVRELRERGFDAVDGGYSYDDLVNGGKADSGYYVEITPSSQSITEAGNVGVSNRNVSVDLEVLVAHAAAELRVYDGKTLNLITTRNLHRRNVTVVPTAVGAGSYRAAVWIALPFIEYVRYRAAVGAVVEDAATEIASVMR
jgi:hypothetical protein